MAEQDTPQIYLISPPQIELSRFSETLASILDARDIACFRLALASEDEDDISRAADLMRETCHARDVAIVIEQHFRLVDRLGLDGVHLPDGPRQVRDVRVCTGLETTSYELCTFSTHQSSP